MHGSRGGGDRGPDPPPPPLKNYKAIWFLSNTGPDHLENHKAAKPSIQCWAIIGSPVKRHLNGFSLVDR